MQLEPGTGITWNWSGKTGTGTYAQSGGKIGGNWTTEWRTVVGQWTAETTIGRNIPHECHPKTTRCCRAISCWWRRPGWCLLKWIFEEFSIIYPDDENLLPVPVGPEMGKGYQCRKMRAYSTFLTAICRTAVVALNALTKNLLLPTPCFSMPTFPWTRPFIWYIVYTTKGDLLLQTFWGALPIR